MIRNVDIAFHSRVRLDAPPKLHIDTKNIETMFFVVFFNVPPFTHGYFGY